MVRHEVQASGEPRTAHKQRRQEQRESQPLPNVWEVLEQKVLLHNLVVMNDPTMESKMVTDAFGEQAERLREKGSDYARAVLDLFIAVVSPRLDTGRFLTLKQFKQLRSDFEELSPEEIVEGKHQILQEMQQLR